MSVGVKMEWTRKKQRLDRGSTGDAQRRDERCTREEQGTHKGCTRDARGEHKGFRKGAEGGGKGIRKDTQAMPEDCTRVGIASGKVRVKRAEVTSA